MITLELEELEFYMIQFRNMLNIYNKTDAIFLSYVFLYGKESRYKLLEDNILKSKSSVGNRICYWRSKGILDQTELKIKTGIPVKTDTFGQTVMYVKLNNISN